MSRVSPFLLVAVLATSGCADATTRMLRKEHLTIRREIRDVAAEIVAIEKSYEAGERALATALEKQTDPNMRAITESRLASVRSDHLQIPKLLQSFEGQRRDGDRIFWVGTKEKAQTCYVLVRDGAIVVRGGLEHWIE